MDEKKAVVDSGSSQEIESGSNSYDAAATKKLIRKIDLVLIPWLAFLYLYYFLPLSGILTDLSD